MNSDLPTPTSLTKGEQTRNLITDAAHHLFLEQGYHGTSMRQIAARAGVALGSIYNHFATKEAIFEMVFITHHPYNQIVPAVRQATGDSPETLLRSIASSILAGLAVSPEFLHLLFIDMVEFQSRNTVRIFESQFPVIEQVLTRLIEVAGPRLRPIPPLLIARSFFGLFFSYYITGALLRYATNLPREIQENDFEYFMNIYLHGILNESGDND